MRPAVVRYTVMEPAARVCQCGCSELPHQAEALVSGIRAVDDGLVSVDFWCCSPTGVRRAVNGVRRLSDVVCVVVSVMALEAVIMPVPLVHLSATDNRRLARRWKTAPCAKKRIRA